MPIVWRYLISQFLKVFFLSVFAFIAVLLTLRLEEIAHFASLDSSREYILWFILYQIPYILPIAIPLSALISAMILIQKLSRSHEIEAFRALGFSLKSLFAPILTAAALLSIFNFIVVSELATLSHFKTSLLKTELRSMNPLLLLHNKHLLKMKGIYYDSWGPSKMGESASDVVLALPGKKGQRINLMIAQNLSAAPDAFTADHITVVTPLNQETLAIENIQKSVSNIEDFAGLVQKKVWSVHDDYLGFKLLLVRIEAIKKDIAREPEVKTHKRALYRLYSELARRLNLSIAPFLFTLLGLSFGLTIGRRTSRKNLLCVTGLAALYMTTVFLAKGVENQLEATLLLYSIPPLLMIAASFYNLSRITRGYDT